MYRIVLSILLSLAAASGLAASNMRFSHITSNDGLSQSEVYSFLKDSEGYMWFGTVQGLNMFDGYKVIRFLADNTDSTSLVNSTVRSLAEDKYGRIWVATDSGLDCFDKSSRVFRHIALPSEIKQQSVYRLAQHGDKLYIGTNVALYVMNLADPARVDDIKSFTVAGIDGTHWITAIAFSGESTLYIGTGLGVVRLTMSENDSYLPQQLPGEVAAFHCRHIERIDLNTILLAGDGGLMIYHEDTGEIVTDPDFKPYVYSVVTDPDGCLWISAKNQGLYKVDVSSDKFEFKEHLTRNNFDERSLSSDLTSYLYISDDNILWVGTFGSGIDYANVNDDRFNHIGIPPIYSGTTFSSSFTRSVYCNGDNNVYIGLHSNGLVSYDRSTGEYTQIGLETFPVFDIKPFEDDKLLVCSGGLYELDKQRKLRKIPGLNSTCFCVKQGRDGIYWVATWSGLYKLDTRSGWPYSFSRCEILSFSTMHYNNCRVLEYDYDNSRLWVGTEGGGLLMLDIDGDNNPAGITEFNDQSSTNRISNSYVRSLYLDADGLLWVGTYDGLNVIDTSGEEMHININIARDLLPNNVIQIVTGDSFGNIWLGTNEGLTRLSPGGQASTFTINDGLQNNEFSEHACCTSLTGEMFFCGIKGITHFYPSNITLRTNFNETVVTSLEVKDKKSRERICFYAFDRGRGEDRIILEPTQNELNIEMSSMVFDTPSKIRYKYFLEGYDNVWNYTRPGEHTIAYTNLSHGRYVFKVIACNQDGLWGDEPTRVDFVIKTPLLIRVPFLLLYFLAIISFMLLLARGRIRRITEKDKLKLENEHNKRLHELDMLRTRFFVNISHDLRTPLTLITGPLEQINASGKADEFIEEKVSLAYKNARKLKYMVEQLLDFRKVEVGKEKLEINRVFIGKWISEEIGYFAPTIKERGLELRLNLQLTDYEVLMDCRKVSKILFNLMSNAIKFTSAGYILVDYHVRADEGVIQIVVEDSGKGISPDALDKIFERFFSESDGESTEMGYGIGLSYCKDLACSMEGSISARSELGKGSCFTLTIPLITEADVITPLADNHDVSLLLPDQNAGCPAIQPWSDQKQTVLVVDDNVEMRNYIGEVLTDKYNVDFASNGKEGRSKAGSISVDIIVSDVMMPVMDGLEFVDKIKSDINTCHIPVILLSAKTEIEAVLSGYKCGADDYVAKPFDARVLQAKIASILDNRERIRSIFQKGLTLDIPSVNIPDSDKEFVDKVIRLIEQNIDNPDYTISSMQNEMLMSHSNFFRKLKALTGMSGKELLQTVRLRHAEKLLKETKLTVSEIAYMSGLSDPKYFSFSFKKQFGVAPMKLREQQNQSQ